MRGYHALLGSDETDAILEDSNVPTNLRFLVACSEADASALLAKASDIASMSNNDYKLSGRVSVIDGIVEVSGVRRVSGFDLEANPDGDSAHIETLSRNRFIVTGKLIAFRLRPHPLWGQSAQKR